MIKIPSACNLNFEMLDYILNNFNNEIHLSLGMTTRKEELNIINFFRHRNQLKNLILYACTSDYPVKYEDVYLLELKRLKKDYGHLVKGIGFSGHHKGIIIDIVAMMIGVDYIERHFSFDRSWKGTDHSSSLEPYDLNSLIKNMHNIKSALQSKPTEEILECEKIQRNKLKKIKEQK